MNTPHIDLTIVWERLAHFATLEDFWQRFETIYGKEYNADLAASLRAQWARGDFSQLPAIQMINSDILGLASGAYAKNLNTIYLSASFWESATPKQKTAVMLEEIGHFVDGLVNVTDTAGDEGAIFAALVLGQPLSDATLQAWQQEDDTKTIVIGGELVSIEQALIPGGTPGNDVINLGNGNNVDNGDTVDGGAGNDTLIVDFTNADFYGLGFSSLGIFNHGEGINKSYYPGERLLTISNIENLNITGTRYRDNLQGFAGTDILSGGAENDIISGSVNDQLDGGADYDLLNLDLSSATTPVTINFLQVNNQVSYQDTLVKNFENIGTLTTGSGNDVINLGNTDVLVKGAVINANTGNDTVIADFSSVGFYGLSFGNGLGIFNHGEGINKSYYPGERLITLNNFETFNLTGTPYNDNLQGFAGNDTLRGGEGQDTLNGGGGSNLLLGGPGNDVVSGHATDTLDGGEGSDVLNLDLSDATTTVTLDLTNIANQLSYTNTQVKNFEAIGTIKTGSGNDGINIGSSITVDDGGTVDTGTGIDTLIVNFTNADFYGLSFGSLGIFNHEEGVNKSYYPGERLLTISNVENLNITGTPYKDNLQGFAGTDILNGGAENDIISGSVNDQLDGGADYDLLNLDLSSATIPVTVNFLQVNNQVSYQDTLVKNFENIGTLTTGSGNDVINLGNTDVLVKGAVINANTGNDTVIADFSSIGFYGLGFGNGLGIFNHEEGINKSYYPGERLITLNNFEYLNITGTSYNDNLQGFAGNDTLSGGEGQDTLNGGDGSNLLLGGPGNDVVSGHATDTLDGGEGSDVLNLDLSDATTTVTLDLTNIANQLSYTNTQAKNFEAIGTIQTGSGNDQINLGNSKTVDDGGSVDTGIGVDTLIVDFTNADFYGLSFSGLGIFNHEKGVNKSYYVGERLLTISNVENLNITATPYRDTLQGFAGNDTLNGGLGDDIIHGGMGNDRLLGGGGKDSLYGQDGDDTYTINSNNTVGTIIQDSSGSDTLIIENGQLTLAKAQAGKMGFGRASFSTTLMIDLDQNGILDLSKDLSILDFYNTTSSNAAGSGFIENIGSFSGADILALELPSGYLGTLNKELIINDSVSTEDWYAFKLDTETNLDFSLTNLTGSIGDARIFDASRTPFQHLGTDYNLNLVPGVYYIAINGASNYTLTLDPIPLLDSAGNSMATARDLGFLNGSQTVSDFVGNIDSVDFYRFYLSKAGSFNVTGQQNLTLSLLNSQGNIVNISSWNNLTAGTYYLKVQPQGNTVPYNLTLTANLSQTAVPLDVLRITPPAGSNLGTITIAVTGTQFSPDSRLSLVAPNGTPYPAQNVTWYDASTLAGTFNLQGLGTGLYDVRVESGGLTDSLNDVFTVNNQAVNSNILFNNDNLEVSLAAPDGVRPWWTGEVVITYRNKGQSDMVAPLLSLKADKAQLRFDGQDEFTANPLQFLAGGSDPVMGILSPGESGSITALFLPNPSQVNTQVNFSVDVAKLYTGSSSAPVATTMEWATIKPNLKPIDITDEAWNLIWSNFTQEVGANVAQYQAVLAENATYLSQLGEKTNEVGRLLAFELAQASAFGAIPQRFEKDVFGYGFRFAFRYGLSVDGDGNVRIKLPDRTQSGLFIKQPDGISYLTPDNWAAALVKDGTNYRLTQKDGSKLLFTSTGQASYLEDNNGNRLSFTYSGDRLTKASYANGDSLTFEYNGQGRVTKVTDQAGRSTTYGYDGTGNYLLNVTTPDGTTSYAYVTSGAAKNALSSITYADGSQNLFTYDGQGRLSGQTSNGGAQAVTYRYDSTGGVTITEANGAVTKQFLNDRGDMGRLVDPLNRSVLYRYDDQGNLTQLIGPEQTVNSFSYDAQDNLLSAVNPLGQRLEFTYGTAFDRLTKVQDPKGNPLLYNYDAKGNLTAITYTDGTLESFGYDDKGNLTLSTNRSGQAIKYTYDAKFQLLNKEYADGPKATFTYDARGNLLTAVDSDSNLSFTYDSADRLTKVTDGEGRFVAYTYDTAGRRTQISDQLGHVTKYNYDTLGRLASVKDGSNALIAAYAYDTVGRLSRSDNGNGTYTTYSYDAAGQLLSLVNYKADASVNSRFGYGYDALGRRASMTTLEGVTNYSYDAAGQLIAVSLPSGRLIQYQYDAAGNRTKVIDSGVTTNYSSNALNQYTTVGAATYSYDANGNLISKTQAGNSSSYSYDSENRLISVTTVDGNWIYEYDALGNRIASVHNGQRTEFLLDPTGLVNVMGEYDSNGNLVANYTYGFGLESMARNGSQNYYDFDAIGSVAGLTNSAGSYINQYRYLPFGENLVTTEGLVNPFEFVGQWGVMDEGNGLDFMRARYYSPGLGSFLSPDPLGIDSGDANLYRYVGNNATNQIDPLGLDAFLTFLIYTYGAAAVALVGYSLKPKIESLYNWLAAGKPAEDVIENSTAIRAIVVLAVLQAAASVDLGLPLVGVSTALAPSLIPAALVALFAWAGVKAVRYVDAKIDSAYPNSIPNLINSILGEDIWLPGGLLGPGPSQTIATDSTGVVVSRDPNDVVGPKGFGDQGWLIPDQVLPYMIRFENDKKAIAPAVFVTVTHQIDSDLDWTSFELGAFGFGNFRIDVPEGFQNYEARVDATATMPYYVDYKATFNPSTGQVTWTLTTIDPKTGQLPTGLLDGFLPPNDPETHSGEGFVSYKVEAKPNLATGTQLDAKARIVFDTNDPIDTPLHRNTVDINGPSSSVQALPANSPTSFTVTWGGTDAPGSGIASYDIYVSTDSGPFVLWQDDITATSASHTGQIGHTYAFYSVATDHVGHTEAPPALADTSTTVTSQANITLSISDRSQLEGDSNNSMVFTVDLSEPSTQTVIVQYATADHNNTAKAGSDYIATSGTLTIPAGQLSGQIPVTIIGDTLDENSETFVVNLSNPVGATLLDGQAIGTIEQDDPSTAPLVLKGGTIQIAYVAYYGRPGDPGGLAFWNQKFEESKVVFGGGDPLTGDEESLYNSLAAAFGESAEANRLFGGKSSAQKVNEVYRMAFNRDAEPAGRDFWAGHLDAGNITLANFALYVALGAANEDISTLRNKLASADLMSKAIDTELERRATSTPANEAFGRNWLDPFGDTSASLYAAETALAGFVADSGLG